MAIYTVKEERLVAWSTYFANLTRQISVKKGDLILISVMGSVSMNTPIGFLGSENIAGLRLYYRVQQKDEELVLQIGTSTGQVNYAIMRSDKGWIDFVAFERNSISSKAFEITYAGKNTVFSTTGSNSVYPFSSVGWSILYSETQGGVSDRYSVAFKEFENKIVVPAHTIWNTNDAYLVVKEVNAITTDLEVSYSSDNIVFSQYSSFDPNKIPQARFLKFRAKLSGGEQVGDKSVFEFDQLNAETKLTLGEFIENIQTNLQPKTIYTKQMTEDTSYTEEGARLFEKTISKSEFKKIIKITLK